MSTHCRRLPVELWIKIMGSGGFPVYSLLARVAKSTAPSPRTLAVIAVPNDLYKAISAADLFMLRQLRTMFTWSRPLLHYDGDMPDFHLMPSISCYLVQQGFKAEIMNEAAIRLDLSGGEVRTTLLSSTAA